MVLPLYNDIDEVTGNTPLVRLRRWEDKNGIKNTRIFAKLESFNPGGSAKDRTAAALVKDAIATGRLTPGTVVIESSSGNLGIALARQAILHDFEFHCVVDPRTNETTLALIQAYGGVLHPVNEPDPKTHDWLTARRQKVQDLLDEFPGSINLDQYSNPAAFTAHSEGTMAEIFESLGHAPARVYVAVSTTGTVGGCIAEVARRGAPTQVIAVDAEGSVLYGGARGERLLPGYGAGVATDLSQRQTPTGTRRIPADRAVEQARELARTEAILPGASGGAVMAAVRADIEQFAPGEDVVVILHDGGTAYTGTIYNDQWVEDNLSPADPS